MNLENNIKVKSFLDSVCTKIRWKEVHKNIKEELLDHIYDLVEEYQKKGLSLDDAISKAIMQMGKADTLGDQLNKVHRPKLEWRLLIIVGIFSSLGIGAFYILESNGLIENYSFWEKSLVYLLIGVIIATGMYFFDYRKIKSYSYLLYGGTCLVSLYTLFLGFSLNGARSYLKLLCFNVNIPQATPYLFMIALAGIFSTWNLKRPGNMFKALGLFLIPSLIYLSTPSMVSLFIYGIVFLTLVIGAGAKKKIIFGSLGSFISLGLFMILKDPYRFKRVSHILMPSVVDPTGLGYQSAQSLKAISTAGLWGQGFNFPKEILPNIHTDLIFPYLVYTFGWIAGLGFIILVTYFILRLFEISQQIKDTYGRLLLMGITSILAIQYFWNIAMSLGLIAVASFPLPFVSYGGTQLILEMLIVGLALSIYRRKDLDNRENNKSRSYFGKKIKLFIFKSVMNVLGITREEINHLK